MNRSLLLSAALVIGCPPLQITAAILAMLVAGCATKNDAGVVLYKKPDFLKALFSKGYVVGAGFPKTPISKFARLNNPVSRTTITKGKFKGHEVWSYEWDAPNDEVNNQMFTDVLVKDGIIVDVYEETTDKWQKNPKLHKAAKLASTWEDIGGYMAQAARYQAAANILANYSTTYRQPSTTSSQSSLNNALFASILDQQQQSQTQARNSPRTTTLTGPRGNYLGSISPTGMVLDGRGDYRGSLSDSGMLTGASGQYLGSVSRSGAMTDARGNYRGTVGPGGAISDSQGRYRGTISGGTVTDDKGRSVLFYSQ